MINYINMEVLEALNPLYALPIIAVIVCAFIVYFFGFKSPVQPPSFDGIEEERKSTKKRRAKDSHKGKNLQNGKLSESTIHKIQNAAGKKRETHEKSNVNAEKASVHVDKTSGHAEKTTKTLTSEKSESKAAKKARQLSEKKDVHMKKNEPIIQDDNNDDGWVQLVSKKGRKNRKKEESSSKNENQVNNTSKNQQAKKVEIEISDAAEFNDPVEIKNDINEMVPTLDAKSQRKNKQVKEETKEETTADSDVIKVKDQSSATNGKNAQNSSEKQIPSEKKAAEPKPVAKLIEVSTEIEDSKIKSKKKKKKASEPVLKENDTEIHVSESSTVHDVQQAPTEMTISSTIQPKVDVVDKKDVQPPSEIKPSNVVFDELAGLYPEEKEQRRRKKVRRDH